MTLQGAYTLACILARISLTREQSVQAVELAEEFSVGLTDLEIYSCHENAEQFVDLENSKATLH